MMHNKHFLLLAFKHYGSAFCPMSVCLNFVFGFYRFESRDPHNLVNRWRKYTFLKRKNTLAVLLKD